MIGAPARLLAADGSRQRPQEGPRAVPTEGGPPGFFATVSNSGDFSTTTRALRMLLGASYGGGAEHLQSAKAMPCTVFESMPDRFGGCLDLSETQELKFLRHAAIGNPGGTAKVSATAEFPTLSCDDRCRFSLCW